MPGGTMSVIINKQSILVNYNNLISDKKGKQSAIKFELNNKQLLIVTGYKNPESSSERICIMKAQLDIVENKVKLNAMYRREFFDELSIFITTINPTDVIIAADWNESIDSNQIS